MFNKLAGTIDMNFFFFLQYNIVEFGRIYLLSLLSFFLVSSFLEFPIPEGTAFIGEIGLSGELRMVSKHI